jgi:hypothetical protein
MSPRPEGGILIIPQKPLKQAPYSVFKFLLSGLWSGRVNHSNPKATTPPNPSTFCLDRPPPRGTPPNQLYLP